MATSTLFRPTRGVADAVYTRAFAETTIYPNDWVALSVLDPTTQGPNGDGILEGETLTASDYIYVVLTDSDETTEGLQLGVAMGAGTDAVGNLADVRNDSVAADELVVIQTYGVHAGARTASIGATGALRIGATAGEPTAAAASAEPVDLFLGFAISYVGTFSRVSANDEHQAVTMVRCNG